MTDPLAERHVYGRPDAPVTVLEFGDLECPYCRAAAPVLRELVDTSDGSGPAGVAALPAVRGAPARAVRGARGGGGGRPGQVLGDARASCMSHQDRLAEPDLRAAAVAVGIDPSGVAGDDAQVHAPAVSADYTAGIEAGVRGTPTIFVDGVRFHGKLDAGAAPRGRARRSREDGSGHRRRAGDRARDRARSGAGGVRRRSGRADAGAPRRGGRGDHPGARARRVRRGRRPRRRHRGARRRRPGGGGARRDRSPGEQRRGHRACRGAVRRGRRRGLLARDRGEPARAAPGHARGAAGDAGARRRPGAEPELRRRAPRDDGVHRLQRSARARSPGSPPRCTRSTATRASACWTWPPGTSRRT